MREAIRRLLAGDVPLAEVFINDMLVIGSMVNIALALAGFAMLAAGWPTWLAAVTFFSPQPYNIILLIAVWRSASRSPVRAADLAKIAGIVWFVVMIFV